MFEFFGGIPRWYPFCRLGALFWLDLAYDFAKLTARFETALRGYDKDGNRLFGNRFLED